MQSLQCSDLLIHLVAISPSLLRANDDMCPWHALSPQDAYDTIDFSDNEITKLENFPLFTRLKSLIAHNNRLCRIAHGLGMRELDPRVYVSSAQHNFSS